jgi:exodeoxyribonuclease-3
MRIVSWNINSLRLRLPLLERVVQELNPDVICLQETKVQDLHVPDALVAALGFPYRHYRGEKSYNGVATLSKVPCEALPYALFGGTHCARHLGVRFDNGIVLHNLYVPAGGDLPDPELNPKFAHKLRYLADAKAWFATQDPAVPTIIVGDLNVAPGEHDVWSHRQLINVVSHTPVEVEALQAWYHEGHWQDAHRLVCPQPEKLYSWWSYRNQDWHKSNRGRRLDHCWFNPILRPHFQQAFIHQAARDWPQPSDHVPLVADFTMPKIK